jgi:hypothetical protein
MRSGERKNSLEVPQNFLERRLLTAMLGPRRAAKMDFAACSDYKGYVIFHFFPYPSGEFNDNRCWQPAPTRHFQGYG